ncbi:MAG: rhodanese-like domain-containing protein [Cuniculiplasma sp.]
MENIDQVIEKVKKEEILLLDMRDFESYMRGHIANSVFAPYVEGRWAPEISNFLGSRNVKAIVLYRNKEEMEIASRELKTEGHSLAFFPYEEFKEWGKFQEAHAKNMSSSEFGEKMEEYSVIDVREPYEWNSGHIENAQLIPLNDLFVEYEKLEKNRKYAVVCAHGNRSLYAAIFLADRGFDVVNVSDGMEGLKRSGYF